jgi:hypothetical protein
LSHAQWHNCDNLRTLSIGAETNAELATKARDALSHADHAVRIRVLQFALCEPDSIVLNRQANLRMVHGQSYPHTTCPGVSRDIGQRLLKDTKKRKR